MVSEPALIVAFIIVILLVVIISISLSQRAMSSQAKDLGCTAAAGKIWEVSLPVVGGTMRPLEQVCKVASTTTAV